MANLKQKEKTCSRGHTFFKSSDCPVCPTCEKERKPNEGFLALLAAPARRALENKGIATLQDLSITARKKFFNCTVLVQVVYPNYELH